MNQVEQIFRWAWYYDFGTTPEQSLNRLIGRQCDQSTSHFRMSLDDLLKKFEQDILTQGNSSNVDARAIAGAIAWEYEENWRGRFSDRFQHSRFGDGKMWFGEGIGWGSVHTKKAREFHPTMSDFQLQCLRLEAASAIKLVAEIMNRAAERYFKISEGVWIRDVPSVLGLLFNTSDSFLKKSAEKRKLDKCEPGLVVTLTISQNKMASWIQANLNRFSKFKTNPKSPDEYYAKVDVE